MDDNQEGKKHSEDGLRAYWWRWSKDHPICYAPGADDCFAREGKDGAPLFLLGFEDGSGMGPVTVVYRANPHLFDLSFIRACTKNRVNPVYADAPAC